MWPIHLFVKAACWLRPVLGDRRAATAVEYGLILGCVVIVMIFGLSNLAKATTDMWDNVSTKVSNAK